MRVTIDRVKAWARERDIRLSRELESGDDAALAATLDTLVASGLLTRFTAGSETVYSIEPAHHPMASYYRNIIPHHFLDRTEERREGKEGVSTGRYRGAPVT